MASLTVSAPARIAELERQLHWAHLEIQVLREELRQRRIQQLGPKSETLSNLQLALLTEEEPSTTRDSPQASGAKPLSSLHERFPARAQVVTHPLRTMRPTAWKL